MMTLAPFNEGELVRLVAKKHQYDGGSWRDSALVVQEAPPWAQPEYEYLLDSSVPNSMTGAIKRQWLAPVLREGDVVCAADGRPSGELGVVFKVSKKGRWAVIQDEDGTTEKWYTPELRLVSRRPEPDEVIADLQAQVRRMEDAEYFKERQQLAAQYASDRALAHAGLVRVELLAQWNAELHERLPREKSAALLADIRMMIEKAKESAR